MIERSLQERLAVTDDHRRSPVFVEMQPVEDFTEGRGFRVEGAASEASGDFPLVVYGAVAEVNKTDSTVIGAKNS